MLDYLAAGGTIVVNLPHENRYRAEWFDPRKGAWGKTQALRGRRSTLVAPDAQDWALRITRTAGTARAAPIATSAKLYSHAGQAVALNLPAVGAQASARVTYRIIDSPQHGALSGSGAARTYTPARGFSGSDRFTWQAAGDGWTSNIATVAITYNATGVNTAPIAHDDAVVARAGQPLTFILRYTDPDGPGPYGVSIVARPRHGTLVSLDNDVTYTPAAGFRGEDSFEWLMHDGSNRPFRENLKIGREFVRQTFGC